MDEPVSVVIPTYNRSGLVGRAIASAVAAISAGDEIVVVDDGSTDGTAEVVARQRGAVRYIQAPHRGVSAARNRGIREARNPLVAFLDSDDTWEPDKLTLQRSVMSAFSDVVFCFSTFRVTTKTGAEKGDGLSVWNGKRCDWDTVLGPGVPFSSIGALPPGRPDFCLHLGDLRLPLMEVPLSYIQINTVVVRPRSRETPCTSWRPCRSRRTSSASGGSPRWGAQPTWIARPRPSAITPDKG